MSMRISAAVWDLEHADIHQKLVLLALADWADDNGRCCFTINDLAARVRVSTGHAESILQALEQDGVLRSIPDAPGWRQLDIRSLAKRHSESGGADEH